MCGYLNGDNEVTIENWVLHGRQRNMIKDYDWVCQEDSKVPASLTFKMKGSCFKDINFNCIPNFDLVVICVSKYFTPPKWWYMANNLLNLVK